MKSTPPPVAPTPPAAPVSVKPTPTIQPPRPTTTTTSTKAPAQAPPKSNDEFFGLLNFLKSDPAITSSARNRVVEEDSPLKQLLSKPSAPTAPSTTGGEQKRASGGLFGFLKSSEDESEKPPRAVQTEPRPVVGATRDDFIRPAVATKAAPVEEKKAASGGLFGFLKSTPTPEPEPVKPAFVPPPPKAAAPVEAKKAGGLFGFLQSSTPAESTKSAPAVESRPVAGKRDDSERTRPTVIISTKAAPVEPKQASTGGGLFGFLKSTPAPEPVKPAVATKPAVVEPKVAPVKPTETKKSGGLFGFLSSSSSSSDSDSEAIRPAVATKASTAPPRPAVSVPKPAPKVEVKKFVPPSAPSKPAPAASAPVEPKAPSRGLFGFLQSTPAPTTETPKATAQASKPVETRKAPSSVLGPVVRPTATSRTSTPATPSRPAAPAPAATAKPAQPKFTLASNKPTTPPPTTTKPSTTTPSSTTKAAVPITRTAMNSDFQNKVAKLLKNSQLRISSFQKSTNEYRGGVITAKEYTERLIVLFGTGTTSGQNSDQGIEFVINALVTELPEKDLANKLKSAYNEISRQRR